MAGTKAAEKVIEWFGDPIRLHGIKCLQTQPLFDNLVEYTQQLRREAYQAGIKAAQEAAQPYGGTGIPTACKELLDKPPEEYK